MNGIGVGLFVGLGAVVGLALVTRAQPIEVVATFTFYGLFAGGIFELWRIALAGRKR